MNISINVRCTYEVECEFENVPNEIARELLKRDEVEEGSAVYDWLSDNIKESDATDWGFDIWDAYEI